MRSLSKDEVEEILGLPDVSRLGEEEACTVEVSWNHPEASNDNFGMIDVEMAIYVVPNGRHLVLDVSPDGQPILDSGKLFDRSLEFAGYLSTLAPHLVPSQGTSVFHDILTPELTSFPTRDEILHGLATALNASHTTGFGFDEVKRLSRKLPRSLGSYDPDLIKWVCLYITEAVRQAVGGEISIEGRDGADRVLDVACGYRESPAFRMFKAIYDEERPRLFDIYQVTVYTFVREGVTQPEVRVA